VSVHPKIPGEAHRTLALVKETLGRAPIGVYLHGSAVSGGLRPTSDVDLIVIVSRALTYGERRRLVSDMLDVSGRYPRDDRGRRPVDLMIFKRSDLVESVYPARSEFVYGEWMRDQFEAGRVPSPIADPELTLLLAQARREALALHGPTLDKLLPEIPEPCIRLATAEALSPLLVMMKGDERNVLLTLARMWCTLETGEFVPKDVAADWAIPSLSGTAATVIAAARDEYLTGKACDWSVQSAAARQASDELKEYILSLLY